MNITDVFKEDNKSMSLSEQRLREAEQRKWGLGLENSDPYLSEEKYNGINATIAGESYYNPDECVKQAMIKFQTQGEQAIKAVKVRREGQGQFMCTEKDMADIKAQFPEGKRNVAGPGPLKIMRMRRIKKWCGAICCFDVEESQMGYFNEKRKVYTLNDVRVFFYHKNSDGIGSEIILKNKFMRLRKRAGKSKDIKTSKESLDPTKSEESLTEKGKLILNGSILGVILLSYLGISIPEAIKRKRDEKLKKEIEKNQQAILEMKETVKNSNEAKKLNEAIQIIAKDFETMFNEFKNFPKYFKTIIDNKIKNGSLNEKFNFITLNMIQENMDKFDGLNKIKLDMIERVFDEYNIRTINDLSKVKEIEYSMAIFYGEGFDNRLEEKGDELYNDPDLREDFEAYVWEDALKAFSEKYIVSKLKTKNIEYGCYSTYASYGINLTRKL